MNWTKKLLSKNYPFALGPLPQNLALAGWKRRPSQGCESDLQEQVRLQGGRQGPGHHGRLQVGGAPDGLQRSRPHLLQGDQGLSLTRWGKSLIWNFFAWTFFLWFWKHIRTNLSKHVLVDFCWKWVMGIFWGILWTSLVKYIDDQAFKGPKIHFYKIVHVALS